jgi:hypothetical protein
LPVCDFIFLPLPGTFHGICDSGNQSPPKRNPSDLLTKAVTEVDWNRTIDELRGLSPIDYVTLSSDPDLASLSIELSPSPILAVKDYPPSLANAVKGLPDAEMSMFRFMNNLLNSIDT